MQRFIISKSNSNHKCFDALFMLPLCNSVTPRLCLAFVLPRDQVSVLFYSSPLYSSLLIPHELLVEIMAALQNVDVLSWCIYSFCTHGKNSTHDETISNGLVSYPSNPTTYYLFTNPTWYDTAHYYTKSIAVCLLQCIQYYLVASFTLHIQESMYDFQHYYFQMQTWMSSQRMCVVLYISFSYIIPHQHYLDNRQYHP